MFDGILKEGNLTNEECISVIGQTPKNAKISENADIVFLFNAIDLYLFLIYLPQTRHKNEIRSKGPINHSHNW